MNRTLVMRSARDNWMLLISCCALSFAFVWLRVWVASKIKMETFVKIFAEGLSIFSKLLPVPIEELASPLGRAAFSYEEGPVILLLGLWTVTRGSDCLAGRLGSGAMEMLLAQPLRRIRLVTSHSVVTLIGVLLLGLACWLGLGAGLATSEFDPPPALRTLLPAAINYVGLGAFLLGASTFASAVSRTRSQAVAAVMGFYVVELAFMIVGRLSPSAAWLERLTILSAYEPTKLTLGMAREAAAHWPMFWQHNAALFGLGTLLWIIAAAIFCRRDVQAPL
jgi:ABC-type transport system involved in multi-copper enzyme maturation permease subunit